MIAAARPGIRRNAAAQPFVWFLAGPTVSGTTVSFRVGYDAAAPGGGSGWTAVMFRQQVSSGAISRFGVTEDSTSASGVITGDATFGGLAPGYVIFAVALGATYVIDIVHHQVPWDDPYDSAWALVWFA